MKYAFKKCGVVSVVFVEFVNLRGYDNTTSSHVDKLKKDMLCRNLHTRQSIVEIGIRDNVYKTQETTSRRPQKTQKLTS